MSYKMNPRTTLLKMTILATTTILLSGSERIELQDKRNCLGNYKLETPKRLTRTTAMGNTTVTLLTYPKTVKVLYFKRQKHTVYCENQIKWTTNCNENTKFVGATPSEIRRMYKAQVCAVGNTCGPDQCTGSDSGSCNDDTVNDSNKPKDQFEWLGREDKTMLFYSCIKEWICKIDVIELDLYIIHANTKQYSPFVALPKIGHTNLAMDFFMDGVTTDDTTYTSLEPPPEPTTELHDATCYSTSVDKTRCLIEIAKTTVSIEFDKFGFGAMQNYVYKISSVFQTIRQGKLTQARPSEAGDEITISDGSEDFKAASIGDLKETIATIQTVQMQDLYNLEEIRDKIIQIELVLRELVKSMSKKDSRLLSRIMDRQLATKWISDENFRLCPMAKLEIEEGKTCSRTAYYEDGEYYTRDKNTSCQIFGDLELNIPFLEPMKLSTRTIKQLEARVAETDSKAWETIKNMEEESRRNSMTVNDIDNSGGTGKTNYFDMTPSWVSWDNFYKLGSICSVVLVINKILAR